MIPIRLMTAEDLPLGMRLKSQAGWNQTPADWRRFLAMQPEGCLVAELDGVAVGTAVVTAFEAVALISMVLVEQEHRGRGVGKALMNRAIQVAEELGCRTIRLDATPLGRPLYEALGFVAQYGLTRYAGMSGAVGDPSTTASLVVRFSGFEDINAILTMDAAVTGTQRGKFLTRLFAEEPSAVRVAQRDGRIAGYFAFRPGSDALQLGPCIALTDEAGIALLTDALSRYIGSRVYWDFPSSHSGAVALAKSAGLSAQRQLLRMCRGEAVNDDDARLWASSGPELG
ncbi:MAG: GNAT family N-acetyltransferase [Pirellulaceae bacterium]|nr:GNAT family N-acetyltransferase [Pirellulaceae bacterium]